MVAVTRRDGGVVALRPIEEGDAAGLLALERAVVAARSGMVLAAGELPEGPAAVAESIRAWTEGPAASPMGVRLVAVGSDGALVAEGTLRRLAPSLIRHTAVLALQVHPDHQGQGLGRAVLEGLLAWARRPTAPADRVLRVELYVRADNPRAIALYRSRGFEREGVRRAFVRADDGHFVDDWVMGLLLAPAELGR